MTTFYYRSMAEENGKPKIGRSARCLGVRPGIDITVEQVSRGWLDEQGCLCPEADKDGSGELVTIAVRDTRGMSTSLSIESLPIFRKPVTFGGKGNDPLWQIEAIKIAGDLEAVQDSPTHVSILPSTTMLLEKYEAAIAKTQNDWKKVG
jgi:hypothetical protein